MLVVCVAALAVGLGGRVSTQQGAAQGDWGSSGNIQAFHVQGNVHLLVGAGGNVAVQTGPEGVLFVDTGLAAHADKVLAAARKLSNGAIRWIVNTHHHDDHTGGNDLIAKAGSTTEGNPTAVVAYESVLTRMSAEPAPGRTARASVGWPTSTYVTGSKDFFFNDEPVVLRHVAGHTDGDSIVFFRRSDVLMAGDLYDTTSYPRIERAEGGTVQGLIDGLNLILDIAVPAHNQEGGTYVVPGHGRVGDEADVLEYRDMVTIIRDRIRDMVSRKQTLAQVQASKPSLDYDRQYGLAPGAAAKFVESIYQDLASASGAGSRR